VHDSGAYAALSDLKSVNAVRVMLRNIGLCSSKVRNLGFSLKDAFSRKEQSLWSVRKHSRLGTSASVPRSLRRQESDRIYHPVQDWETRLLCLAPAEDRSAPLKCELKPITLIYNEGVVIHDQKPRSTHKLAFYEALSYTWGSEQPIYSIDYNQLVSQLHRILPPHYSTFATQRYLDTSG